MCHSHLLPRLDGQQFERNFLRGNCKQLKDRVTYDPCSIASTALPLGLLCSIISLSSD